MRASTVSSTKGGVDSNFEGLFFGNVFVDFLFLFFYKCLTKSCFLSNVAGIRLDVKLPPFQAPADETKAKK